MGTIADRGLYPVFMIAGDKSKRVGELDEEMVFETKVGDVIVLGVSTWRVLEITFDRVVVEPAPHQMGRLPFWRGEHASRSYGLGKSIGANYRKVLENNPPNFASLGFCNKRSRNSMATLRSKNSTLVSATCRPIGAW